METHHLLFHVKKGSREFQLSRISTPDWRIEDVDLPPVVGKNPNEDLDLPPVEIENPGEFCDGHRFEDKNPNEDLDLCEESNPSAVASCKGLICLEYHNGKHVLWNPSTNSYKFLHQYGLEPLPCPLRHTSGCTMSTVSTACGLGFVDETQDYKFIRLLRNYYDDDDEDRSCHGESERLELYSLANNSWKEISFKYSGTHSITGRGTYVNGLCYWDCYCAIVSFDFGREEFSILPYPDPNMRGFVYGDCSIFLTELHGCLCVVVYPDTRTAKHFKFWVMKEDGGWSRNTEYDVLLVADVPLGFCKNGKHLFLQGIKGTMLVYNYIARKLTAFEEICGYLLSMSVFPYVESTVQFSALKPTECIETTLKWQKSGLKKRSSRRGTLTREKRDEEKKKKKKKKRHIEAKYRVKERKKKRRREEEEEEEEKKKKGRREEGKKKKKE